MFMRAASLTPEKLKRSMFSSSMNLAVFGVINTVGRIQHGLGVYTVINLISLAICIALVAD